MFAKLIRCAICHHWYSPKAHDHCDSCGCARVIVNRKHVYVDPNSTYKPGILVASGIYSYQPPSNLFTE